MSDLKTAIEFLMTLVDDENVNESLRKALAMVIEQLCLTSIDLENCQRDLKTVSDQLAYTYYLSSLPREVFGSPTSGESPPFIQ